MDHTMKNILFLFAALLTLVSSSVVKADEGAYGQVFGGVNWTEDAKKHHLKYKFKTGYVVGGAIGFQWCNNLRAEGEFAYRDNKLDRVSFRQRLNGNTFRARWHGHNSLRTWSVLANLYYDIPLECSWFQPYIGAGIGYGNNKIARHRWDFNANNGSGCYRRGCRNQNGFAWQFIAGLGYPICDNIIVDVEYRYFQSHKHVRANDLVFGAKYGF